MAWKSGEGGSKKKENKVFLPELSLSSRGFRKSSGGILSNSVIQGRKIGKRWDQVHRPGIDRVFHRGVASEPFLRNLA